MSKLTTMYYVLGMVMCADPTHLGPPRT